MINNRFREKGWLYLWHKDNNASINSEDVKAGSNMYISACMDLECDGYDGTVGKARDFREKLYVEFEYEIGNSELVEFKDENGELDTCEVMWVEIIDVLGDSDE